MLTTDLAMTDMRAVKNIFTNVTTFLQIKTGSQANPSSLQTIHTFNNSNKNLHL